MRTILLAAALAFPAASALACPGVENCSNCNKHASAEGDAATHCAKNAELVGSACSYSTGMMAQRVHTDGKELAVKGPLAKSDTMLDSHVAAPFTTEGYYVIANEVLETIENPSAELALKGKALEVDGVKYFLITSFSAS